MDMDKGIHECECLKCQAANEHPEWQVHHQMNLLVSRLDEQQRRWYVAIESRRVGHGGDKLLSQITGLDVETIRRGRRELEGELADRPPNRIRKKGGGRPSAEKSHPGSEGS
jgi:hypothetical protein